MLKAILFTSLILFLNSANSALGPVRVREFKYYREISVGDNFYLIDKVNFDIFLQKNDSLLKINNNRLSQSTVYKKRFGEKEFNIYFIQRYGGKSRVGFYARDLTTNYKSEDCDLKGADPVQLITKELHNKIRKMQISTLFDEESCKKMSEPDFAKFKTAFERVLSNAFVKEGDTFNQCLQSADAQKLLSEDPSLRQNINEVLGRYMDLVRLVIDGKSKLKIQCGFSAGNKTQEAKNKVALFSENPLIIALNTLSEKFNLNMENITDVVNHELIHYGSGQFKTQKNSRCMDEGFAQLTERVCLYKIDDGQRRPPNSLSITKSCLATNTFSVDPETYSGTLGHNDETADPYFSQLANLPLENRTENAAVTKNLVAAVNSGTTVFEPLPAEMAQSLATSKVLTASGKTVSDFQGDGLFHQVVSGAEFDIAAKTASNIFDRDLINADGALNKALGNSGLLAVAAVVGQRAVASTPVQNATLQNNIFSSGKVEPLNSTEIFANRYFPDLKENQKTKDELKLANSKDEMTNEEYKLLGKKESIQLGQATESKIQQNSITTMEGTGQTKIAQKLSAGSNPNPKSPSSTVATAPSRGIASVGTAAQAVIPKEKEEAEQPVAKSSASAVNTGPSANPTIKLDNQMIQRLAAFREVKGADYSTISSRYRSDKIFRQQLSERRIGILNSKGAPLWVSATKPSKCFKDTSTMLEQVTCK